MINLRPIKYRLIGISDVDKDVIAEDSVIDIVSISSVDRGRTCRYEYKVISGKVMDKGPEERGDFSTGCRLHAYCVPVGMGKSLLPDLKNGDYIINRAKGSRVWTYHSVYSDKDMSDMRYATEEEINRYSDTANGTAAGSIADKAFAPDDIVVTKEALGSTHSGSIIRIRNTSHGYVSSDDLPGGYLNYPAVNFRHATHLEIDAYKNGYRYLEGWKRQLEIKAIKRFPSPASFTDVFGRKYICMSYEYPEWEGEKLVLPPAFGVVYYLGEWATPAPYAAQFHDSKEKGENKPELKWEKIGQDSYFATFSGKTSMDSLQHGCEIIQESVHFPNNITGREFDEDDFLSNPMNQRMSFPIKKTRKQSVHERINF